MAIMAIIVIFIEVSSLPHGNADNSSSDSPSDSGGSTSCTAPEFHPCLLCRPISLTRL